MSRLGQFLGHLKGYKGRIIGSATAIGFIGDFLQPLAAFSKWILIFCAAICVLSVPLLAFESYRKHVVSAYVYSLLMCLICGPLYYIQLSGYSQYGVLAYIFPNVHSLQNDLGITQRLDNISADINSIKYNVSDIKDEVTKTYRGDMLLSLIKKSSPAERIDLLFDFERYHVVGLIRANDFMKIYELYPDPYKKKLISELSDNVEANLSAEQYLAGFKYPADTAWPILMGDKLRTKMKVSDLQNFFKNAALDARTKSMPNSILTHTKVESSKDAMGVVYLFGPSSLYSVLENDRGISLTIEQTAQYVAKLPKNEREYALRLLMEYTEPINAAGLIQVIQQGGVKPDEVLSCLSSKNVEIKKSSREDFERLKRIANNSFVWRMYDERLLDY